ncbi:MAG: M48 family metallopeptidase [Patescibacteria group bacterium]|nr:M48 family metallopeptidase [Patescibacteria group bacterium]
MLNIYEQVDLNKRRSVLIVFLFAVFFTGFIWALGQLFDTSANIFIPAVIFSLASSLGGYFWGDKIVLNLSGAKPAERGDYFNFYTAAENLAIATQIPMPKLYIIESPAMNAFATGRDPKHAVICATTGLLENLNKSEIEAVIGHEISHITNYDIRLMTVVAVLVGVISIAANWALRINRVSGSRNSQGEKRSVNPVSLVISLLAIILAPIGAKLIQLALSRRREYLADASSVKLTKQPAELISALKKLTSSQAILATASPATAHLFIVNPLSGVKKGVAKFATLFSTHPPIEERIAILEKML